MNKIKKSLKVFQKEISKMSDKHLTSMQMECYIEAIKLSERNGLSKKNIRYSIFEDILKVTLIYKFLNEEQLKKALKKSRCLLSFSKNDNIDVDVIFQNKK